MYLSWKWLVQSQSHNRSGCSWQDQMMQWVGHRGEDDMGAPCIHPQGWARLEDNP